MSSRESKAFELLSKIVTRPRAGSFNFKLKKMEEIFDNLNDDDTSQIERLNKIRTVQLLTGKRIDYLRRYFNSQLNSIINLDEKGTDLKDLTSKVPIEKRTRSFIVSNLNKLNESKIKKGPTFFLAKKLIAKTKKPVPIVPKTSYLISDAAFPIDERIHYNLINRYILEKQGKIPTTRRKNISDIKWKNYLANTIYQFKIYINDRSRYGINFDSNKVREKLIEIFNRPSILKEINSLREKHNYKVTIHFELGYISSDKLKSKEDYLKFNNVIENNEESIKRFSFNSKEVSLANINNFDDFIRSIISKNEEYISNFELAGSGVIVGYLTATITFREYSIQYGGSMTELPNDIRIKEAIVNPKCDSHCFIYAFLICIHYLDLKRAGNLKRFDLKNYQRFISQYNFSMFPSDGLVDYKSNYIELFETINRVAVNIYELKDKEILATRLSGESTRKAFTSCANILFYNNHYFAITNLGRLLRKKGNLNKRKFICEKCTYYFNSRAELETHLSNDCNYVKDKWRDVKFGKKKVIKFSNYDRTKPIKYLCFADFEALIINKDEHVSDCIDITEEQIPSRVSYLIVETNKDLSFNLIHKAEFKGLNCSIEFMNDILKMSKELSNSLICYFHNGSRYDFHFIVKNIIPNFPNLRTKVLARSDEHFSVIEIGPVIFRDSYKMLSSSLDELVKSLKLSNHTFNLLKQFYPNLTSSQLELLSNKGTYPYEYFTSFDKYRETELPPIETFNSSLNIGSIYEDKDLKDKVKSFKSLSNKAYEDLKVFWKTLNIKDLDEFSSYYVNSDVILLAECFLKTRLVFLSNPDIKLDCAFYISAPAFSYDVFLKYSKVQYKTYNKDNYSSLILMKRMMRGGISQISTKYCKSSKNRQILYFDANNLYGFAMSQKLPIEPPMLEKRDGDLLDYILSFNDSEIGYIVSADIEAPLEIHDKLRDYPMFPEKIKLPGDSAEKLILSLEPKKDYPAHYLNIRLAHSLGYKIKINNIYKFRQTNQISIVVEYLANVRKQFPKKSFENGLYKLLANSFFGKSIENSENNLDVKLVTTREEYFKYSSKNSLRRVNPIEENLIFLEFEKQFKVDKPYYLGVCILEISKWHMYSMWYKYFQPNGAHLLMTDTDSFICSIPNSVKFIKNNSKYLDLSVYDEKSELYSPLNKGILGKLKDETPNDRISEFVGLKPKLYSYLLESSKNSKTVGKGIFRTCLDKLSIEDYKDVLTKNKVLYCENDLLRSKDHTINKITNSKVALSSTDNKRVEIENYETVPYGFKGQFLINNIENLG